MGMLLKGKEVASHMNEQTAQSVVRLKEQGIQPCLAIVRVGNRADDMSYEQGATKRCNEIGIQVKSVVMPEMVTQEELIAQLHELNGDSTVHGILMFRPLPKHMDEKAVCEELAKEKDIDGITMASMAGVYANSSVGYAPCTAQAVIEILDYYGIDCKGKKAVVIGRSLVVGRPVAMLLMHKNATVTICHTKTVEMEKIVKDADIVVVCAGKMESIGKEYFSENQIVVDVGIGWNEEKNKLCGDVRFEEVEPIVGAITPVPGGVGSVTTSILVCHVVKAAENTK